MTSTSTAPINTSTTTPPPGWLPVAAVTSAFSISAIALFDAFTHGLTGEYSAFQDDGGLSAAGTLVHGVGYLVLTAVLVLRSAAIDGGSGAVRWFRRLTAASMGALGMVFLVGTFTQAPAFEQVGGAIASVAFLTMFLFGAALGVTLLVRGRRTPAAWSLAAILPAVALLALLAFTVTDWAHPAYPETAVHFGVALLAFLRYPRTQSD